MIEKLAKDQNWAKITPVLGIITAVGLFLRYQPSDVLFWALVNIPLYMFHQMEEHFWPGGFKDFINQVINGLPEGEENLSDVQILWINILLVWLVFTIFGALATINIGFGLLIVIFSVINCLTHIAQGVRLRRWNPGLVMASIQFLVSLYAAYFITVNGLGNPVIWWAGAVLAAAVTHAVLFRLILIKD